MENKFLLLIDGSSLLSTQFYGNLPREVMFAKTLEEKAKNFHKIMMTSTGTYTNAVFGFMRTLIKIIKEQKPDYLAVAWDVSRNTFRRELYAEYKGNRTETMEPLKTQFALCQDVLKRMGIVQLMDEHFEADDFCGSIAKKFEASIPIKILTKDNDYLQLVTENTNLWMMHSTAEKTDSLFKKYNLDKRSMNVPDRAFNYTPELVKAEFGIDPCHVNSLKGLMGDASDNIKGVAGVGEATAIKLIQEYGTVENLYQAIRGLDKDGEKKIKEYWKEKLGLKRSPLPYLLKESDTELVGEKAAFLSEQLATIKCDIDLHEMNLEDFTLQLNIEEAKQICDELEFKSLRNEFEQGWGENKEEEIFTYELIEEEERAKAIFNEADNYSEVGIQLLAEDGFILGIAVSFELSKAYFIRKSQGITDEQIKEWVLGLEKKHARIYAMDLKAMLPYLQMKESKKFMDIGVAAYLLNPLESSYTYEVVAQSILNVHFPSKADLFGKKKIASFMESAPEVVMEYGCQQAICAMLAGPKLLKMLADQQMLELYRKVELPLIYCLYRMEDRGIMVKAEELEAYGKRLFVSIQALEQEIYGLTGEEFNINSPKQLGEILFGKLNMPYGKKTKTGYSTSADVLEKLAPEYPVVGKILEYRQLTKLKSTYADGLATYIGKDGRIHSTFNQTITATGRISSTEPNLQNIPIRMELGREIRKVFVPEEGYVFVDADYSQIELRVLAHMSGDESLIEAYRTAQDIHALTASQVFHTPLEEVTSLQRRNAKAVNFGIVYGISAFGLSEDLSITRKEALEYIEKYFETYPKVKEFLDKLVEQGKEDGFVSTLYHRRRPIPELKSTNFMQRSFGERIAMNSPIQGTAADIMKVAMIRVDDRLIREKLKSRVVLQVHDELLVETWKDELEEVKRIITEEMHAAADLEVPLEIDLQTGNSWFETK